MNDSADLERRYSRLLAWYPAAFRREHEAEMLDVLMENARQGQRRVGLAEAGDLIRGALTLRLRVPPQAPRTVVAAVRLIYAGAAVALACWISALVTKESVSSAMKVVPADRRLMLVHITAVEILVPVSVAGWLWLAWATGRGHRAARIALVSYFALLTPVLLWMLGIGAAVYAPADLISLSVLWLVQLSAIVLVFNKRSEHYYRPAKAGGHPLRAAPTC
jgi:F0F1-type ATP synthase membrane subunit c/vacuolar-type H+-ATPase subunit K